MQVEFNASTVNFFLRITCTALNWKKGGEEYYLTCYMPTIDFYFVTIDFSETDWFSPATVHRLERQVVPHFFSGKLPDRTPEKYMEIRNFVVAKYMENPEKRVTVSDCQGLVDGVSNEDLTRIVRFLDHWGIINYCAPTPSCEPWNSNSYLREDMNGEIHVPSAALKPIDSLVKFDKPKCRLKAADVYSALPCRDDIDGLCDLDNRIRERLAENHCSSCSRSVPIAYYQSQKEVSFHHHMYSIVFLTQGTSIMNLVYRPERIMKRVNDKF